MQASAMLLMCLMAMAVMVMVAGDALDGLLRPA